MLPSGPCPVLLAVRVARVIEATSDKTQWNIIGIIAQERVGPGATEYNNGQTLPILIGEGTVDIQVQPTQRTMHVALMHASCLTDKLRLRIPSKDFSEEKASSSEKTLSLISLEALQIGEFCTNIHE